MATPSPIKKRKLAEINTNTEDDVPMKSEVFDNDVSIFGIGDTENVGGTEMGV
jgi:hypothetical protein